MFSVLSLNAAKLDFPLLPREYAYYFPVPVSLSAWNIYLTSLLFWESSLFWKEHLTVTFLLSLALKA